LIGYLPWAASLTVMITQMPFEMILAAVLILALYKAFHRRAHAVFDDDEDDE
jgi:fumarate reductase subunit D